MELGFALSSEDHPPSELVRHASIAEQAGHERAHKLWPNLALAGSGGQELSAPRDFEEAAAHVTVEDVAESTPAGRDPEPYLKVIRKYGDAGFTHLYIHQIGDNQEEFAEFARRELLNRL